MSLRLRIAQLWIVGAVCGTLLCASPAAMACEAMCVAFGSVDQDLRRSDRALVGRVIAVAEEPDGSSRFTLQVVRAWKGNAAEVSLRSFGGEVSCGKRLREGRAYFAFLAKGQESIDICSAVDGVWEPWIKRTITQLDRLRGFPPLALPAEDLRPPGGRW